MPPVAGMLPTQRTPHPTGEAPSGMSARPAPTCATGGEGTCPQLIEVDWMLTVDSCIAGPEDHLPRPRVNQASMLAVGLVRQRGGDLLYIDHVQVEHPVSVRPGKRAVGRPTGVWPPRDSGEVGHISSTAPRRSVPPLGLSPRRSAGGPCAAAGRILGCGNIIWKPASPSRQQPLPASARAADRGLFGRRPGLA